MRLLLSLCLTLSLSTAFADTVRIPNKGVILEGNITLTDDSTLAGKDIVLILHGTMAHNKMEIIATMQELLAEQGINSLAISLSLGASARTGMLPCTNIHTHKHSDALNELNAWTKWLRSKKIGRIHLLGHSRGGNQIAHFYIQNLNNIDGKVALIAPMTYTGGTPANLSRPLQSAKRHVKAGHDEVILSVPSFLHCADSKVSAASLLSYYTETTDRDTPTVLSKLKTPVLVIAGGDDTVVENLPDRMRTIAPRHKLIIVDGADHFFRDFYADELSEILAQWYQ